MTIVREVIQIIEGFAPSGYQESYDNSGIQVGDPNSEISGVLLCIDVTEDVVDEAVLQGANLIISHHPLIFNGIKRLSGNNSVEKIIIKSIKADITIYSCHTNIDNVSAGVSFKMGQKLNLINMQVLRPLAGTLCKLVVFVPVSQADGVRIAIFEAGGGHIGNYDCCSYNLSGEGTFRALNAAHPYVGEKNQVHKEQEIRIETIFPKIFQNKVVSAMLKVHPYEEVAYDIYPLNNQQKDAGAGVIGEFEHPLDSIDFFHRIKNVFGVQMIRHTEIIHKKIQKVALCGGSGSFLLPDAKKAKADIFVTADFKYHQFFDAEKSMIIADIGHFESEQFTLEIFYDLLVKNFSNFAIRFTKVKTNPINYF